MHIPKNQAPLLQTQSSGKQGPGTRSSTARKQAATSGPAKQPPLLLAKRTPRPIFITLSTRQRLPHGHGPVPGPHRSPFRPCSSARHEGFCPVGGEDRICCVFLPALSSSRTQHLCEPAYPLSSSSQLCLPGLEQPQPRQVCCRQLVQRAGWFWGYQRCWHLFSNMVFRRSSPPVSR